MNRKRTYQVAAADKVLDLTSAGYFRISKILVINSILNELNEDEETFAILDRIDIKGHLTVIYAGALFPFMVGLSLVQVPYGTTILETQSTNAHDLQDQFETRIDQDFQLKHLVIRNYPTDVIAAKSDDYTNYVARYNIGCSYTAPKNKSIKDLAIAGLASNEAVPEASDYHNAVLCAWIYTSDGTQLLAVPAIGYDLYYREISKEKQGLSI